MGFFVWWFIKVKWVRFCEYLLVLIRKGSLWVMDMFCLFGGRLLLVKRMLLLFLKELKSLFLDSFCWLIFFNMRFFFLNRFLMLKVKLEEFFCGFFRIRFWLVKFRLLGFIIWMILFCRVNFILIGWLDCLLIGI